MMRIQIDSILRASISVIMILIITPVALSAETIAANLSTVNSGSERREAKPVRYLLPPEINKKNLLETAGMEVRYDQTKATLYLYDEVDLNPGETKEYRIVFEDIWTVDPKEIEALKQRIAQRLKYMEDTEDYNQGKIFADHLNSQLDLVVEQLGGVSNLTVIQRIEMSRIHNSVLQDIEGKTTVMSDFAKESKWFSVGSDSVAAFKFTIRLKNRLQVPKEDYPVKKYLPRGVGKEHIVDSKGLKVNYDPANKLFYLSGKESLGALEERSIEIEIKNVWRVPDDRIDMMISEGLSLAERLKGSQYESDGVILNLEVESLLNEVKASQKQSETPLDIIANHAINMKRFTATDDALVQLRRMVNEIEHRVPQTVPYYTKPITTDISTTWKIIYGMIGIMTVVGLLAFVLWWGQSQKTINKTYTEFKPE
ncbi:MAG: hypothetical protein ACI9Y8_000967 [Candidatus Omnitrophota bacterium]|jgi:hypothetical protein